MKTKNFAFPMFLDQNRLASIWSTNLSWNSLKITGPYCTTVHR
jgi:hypothetical protein